MTIYLKQHGHQLIIGLVATALLAMGVMLFCDPPALFPDSANGFQVLRSMQHGGGFNTVVRPDQSNIAQDYAEYVTWWTPGQYLVPYFLLRTGGLNLGQATAVTVTLCSAIGLIGFYRLFKQVGFTSLVAALSIALIFLQVAFFVPFNYYNGGEILLFGFEGWFLQGCASLDKPGIKIALFVLLAGWIGFFFKSSFLWMYVAGLCCLWCRLCISQGGLSEWIKKGLWIGIPALASAAFIFLFFLSKGQSPANTSNGLKLAAGTFSFPLAGPALSAFSIDDVAHGLIYHLGTPLRSHGWSVAVLCVIAVLSPLLVVLVARRVKHYAYRLFLVVFYIAAVLFFGSAYLRQLNISYEARHFRILGILLLPGVICLVSGSGPVLKFSFAFLCTAIGCYSLHYLYKSFYFNKQVSAHGITGIAQPNIDQQSLNKIIRLDNEHRHAVFVFISNDIGLEITHNRMITLPAIGDNLRIDMREYGYNGFDGTLYVVLPETYNGPKEKLIMKSFTGYAGWKLSMLSKDYVLYEAKMKR